MFLWFVDGSNFDVPSVFLDRVFDEKQTFWNFEVLWNQAPVGEEQWFHLFSKQFSDWKFIDFQRIDFMNLNVFQGSISGSMFDRIFRAEPTFSLKNGPLGW